MLRVMLRAALLREVGNGQSYLYLYPWFFLYYRNIDALVNLKPLVKALPTVHPVLIPWHASCSRCLSDSSTLLIGSATFIHKNHLSGPIICSKVNKSFKETLRKEKSWHTLEKDCLNFQMIIFNELWLKSSIHEFIFSTWGFVLWGYLQINWFHLKDDGFASFHRAIFSAFSSLKHSLN